MSIIFIPVGLERRLLATVRWTVATAVAFPQKSESNRVFTQHLKCTRETKIGDLRKKVADFTY